MAEQLTLGIHIEDARAHPPQAIVAAVTQNSISVEKCMTSYLEGIPFCRLLGMEQEAFGAGRSRIIVPLRPEFLNSNHVAHGGLTFSLADTCMGAAVRSTLEGDERCVTVEMKINYLRRASGAALRSESVVINKGRSVASVESRIWAGEDLVATASGTFAIRRTATETQK